jgi:GcrA cell cycle regulator
MSYDLHLSAISKEAEPNYLIDQRDAAHRLRVLHLKRGHKLPTAKPKIRPAPKRRPALLAACARPVAKKVSKKLGRQQPKEFSKRRLYAMLADAVRNTG